MALTHVCMWEESIRGYRSVSIDEATERYPYTVSAESGIFACRLCGQSVCLTRPGERIRYFKHTSSAKTKECEDRSLIYDRRVPPILTALSSHPMPIRIDISQSGFRLEIGFFSLADIKPRSKCEVICIKTRTGKTFTYSFDRISQSGVTYLGVGDVPSETYSLSYSEATTNLLQYWPLSAAGIPSTGAIFDVVTQKMIPEDGRTSGKCFYLLTRERLRRWMVPVQLSLDSVCESVGSGCWNVYQLTVHMITQSVAQFFLRWSVWLTESPTEFFPIWPPYVEYTPFLCPSEAEMYIYLRSDTAGLEIYPRTYCPGVLVTDGRLYKIAAMNRAQLVSVGRLGADGFSYVSKRKFDQQAVAPTIRVVDAAETVLDQDVYTNFSHRRRINITTPFDGKVVVWRSGVVSEVRNLCADKTITIAPPASQFEIRIYQGCDCVRTIRFEKSQQQSMPTDSLFVAQLQTCSGSKMAVSHSLGAIANKLRDCPETRNWLYAQIRNGEMTRQAYRLLLKHFNKRSSIDE